MPNVITANVAGSESSETYFWDRGFPGRCNRKDTLRVNGTFRQMPRDTEGFQKVLYLPAASTLTTLAAGTAALGTCQHWNTVFSLPLRHCRCEALQEFRRPSYVDWDCRGIQPHGMSRFQAFGFPACRWGLLD